MPFSTPTTIASLGQSGYLGVFSYGSPLVQLLEVKTFSIKRISVPNLNFTHLLSPNTTEELGPGINMPGTLDVSGNFIGSVDQTTDLDTLWQNQTVFAWQYVGPMQRRAKTMTLTGQAYITKFDIGPFEPNRPVEFSVSMQTTGFTSIVVA